MKKRNLFGISAFCLSALALTAAASADTYQPKTNIYKVQLGLGSCMYEEATDRWYRGGSPVEEGVNRFSSEDGYTCDFEAKTVYNPDGSANAALSDLVMSLLDSKFFTFDYVDGEYVTEDMPEYGLTERMIASVPTGRILTLEKDKLVCVVTTGDMPVMECDIPFDSTFKTKDVKYIKCGDITVSHYSGLGDINVDGKMTVSDAVLYARVGAEDQTANVSALGLSVCDINGDGKTDTSDLTAMLSDLAGLTSYTKQAAQNVSAPEPAMTTDAPAASEPANSTEGYCDGTSGGDCPVYRERSLELTAMPYHTEFGLGQKVDLAGCKVSAFFSDADGYENLKDVYVLDYPELFEISGSALTAATPGEYEVTIRYTREFGEAMPGWQKPIVDDTISFAVRITENATPEYTHENEPIHYILDGRSRFELDVISEPTKSYYRVGEPLDLTGCVVDARYYRDGVLVEHLDHVNLADYLDKFDITYEYSSEYAVGCDFMYFSYPKIDGSHPYNGFNGDNIFRFDYFVDVAAETYVETTNELRETAAETTTTTTRLVDFRDSKAEVSMTLLSAPHQTLYRLGESLDLSGCRLSAEYRLNGQLSEKLEDVELLEHMDDFLLSGTAMTASTPGTYSLVITYAPGGDARNFMDIPTKSISIPITIVDAYRTDLTLNWNPIYFVTSYTESAIPVDPIITQPLLME